MLNSVEDLLFSHSVCLVFFCLGCLSFSMQCWRPCPLPPAQPSAALGSSASPLSMRSTITKAYRSVSLLKGCWNKTFASSCPPHLPQCMPHHTPALLTLTFTPWTAHTHTGALMPVCVSFLCFLCEHDKRFGITFLSIHLHEVQHPHSSSLDHQSWQKIMSQKGNF